MEYLSKKEFNLRFLSELQRYMPKVARDLLRECQNDVWFRGWWYAQRRWAKFIGLDKLAEIEHVPLSKRIFKEETRARELPICNYGDGSVHWTNCLPCPLYKDGHCMSKRAIAYRAIHKNQQETGEETDEIVTVEVKKPLDKVMLEQSPIPIEKWLTHHRKRGVKLQGPDGRVIDWLRCLSIWDKLDRPVVYAAPGDPFYDLSLYMYPEKLSPQRLDGIVIWLEEHSGRKMPESPE